MNPHAFIHARGLNHQYPSGTQALLGVDLAVERGQFVSFVGPSGCGKSTLLRLVAGLLPVGSGELTLGGLRPRQSRRTEHSCGFVFQSPTLLPWRNVEENLLLPLELEGTQKSVAKDRARHLLSMVGLLDFAKAWPAQLSGGMRMRVSIARALASRPQVLLMDEPFAALDDLTRGRLQEDLLALRQTEGFTTLFVTHNVAEAVFLSDRVLCMAARPGRILGEVEVRFSQARNADLRDEPEFVVHTRQVHTWLKEAEA